jgi:tetratricopeptide (TPR) repeat protein
MSSRNNDVGEDSEDEDDHSSSYARHREKVEKKTVSKDVSGISLGNVSLHIKKKKLEHDDDFTALEKKRAEAEALIKSAELRENLRTGPWIFIVHLECAKGLRNADIVGKSDPFCTVTLNGRKVGTTKVINNNLNPIWNWSLRLELDQETLGNSWARSQLLIECYDYDLSPAGNDFLGRVLLHGEDFLRTLGLSGNPEDAIRDPISYAFRDPPKGVRKKSRRATGELIMSLSLLYASPPENQLGDIGLNFFIDRAESIAAADSVTGTSDPYIRVFWEHKEVYKTEVKKLTCNPKWKEEVVCKLQAGSDLRQTQLRLDMYDRDIVGKDDFIGRVTIFASDMVERVGKSTYIRKMPGPDAPEKYRFKKRPRGDENRTISGFVYLGLTLEDDWSDIENLVRSKDGSGFDSHIDENDLDNDNENGQETRTIVPGLKNQKEDAQLQSLSWLLAGGKLMKAQDIQRELLNSVIKRFGEGSLNHASVLDHLGHQQLRASRYNEAYKLMDSALIMRQKMYEYKSVATSHDSLGQLAYERGDYAEAEIMLNRALAARMNLLGKDHPATARTMRKMGCLYRSMGRPDESIKMLTKSSEIISKKYGTDSLPMASSLILLARHWRREGKKHKTSLRMCQTVLNIRDFKLGPHHPNTAVALAECAAAFRARGLAHAEYREQDLITAMRYMERCLCIKEHLFGPRSLRLAKTLTNLAHLYRATGKHDKVLQSFERVYELRKLRLGEEHPLTLVSLSGKAAAMTRQHTKFDENGEPIIEQHDEAKESATRAEAKKYLLKALNTSLDKLGRDHPITGKCFKNYVFTKTEDEVSIQRIGLDRTQDQDEQGLSNYLYWWERWSLAIKNGIKHCLRCSCLKKETGSSGKVQPLALERNTHRKSRSGSFLGRLVSKGRQQYMSSLQEERKKAAAANKEGKSTSLEAARDKNGNVLVVGSDPLNLAEHYSALIVQQMDFESGPNQTGEPRPEDKSLIADDGSGKTELEKEKDKKLIESDENAVQELIGSISRPKTPADISQPNTARDRT